MLDCQKKANAEFRKRALKNISVIFSQNDIEAFEALKKLEAHYGSASKAIKQALITHAESIN